MNVALGSAAISLGFAAAVLGIITVAYSLVKRKPEAMRHAPIYVWLILAAGVAAFLVMEVALLTNDFSVKYVAEHGRIGTPTLFTVATLWGALEGSILLWALILAGYLAVVGHRFRNRLADPMVAYALLTMFVVVLFFFGLMLGPADPFIELADPPDNGPGLNPLLQNNAFMAFHPPMLYLGYVGFTVPFAFAIAALATGRVGEGWLVETRRWTVFAWGFLTFGIVLGAWWSYETLGWGGYWAWDPVENASFLPWLTGTAFIHSVMVQERRGMLRVWNLSLVCATFALTILGTFLTRSGVIASVHAFSESGIGPLLLGFFGVIVAVTVGLIGFRGDALRSVGRIDSPLSREGAFLANNVVFASFAFVVLIGTVWPLIIEAINGDRIAVGNPFFDRMTMPIGFVLLFLMAMAPVLPWRKASTEVLSARLFWPAAVGAASMVIALLLGGAGWAPILAFGLAGFAAGAACRQLVLATRRSGWRGLVGRTNGGMIVHLGVILIAVAFAASNSYLRQAEFRFDEIGDSASLAGHEFIYRGEAVVQTQDGRIDNELLIEVDGRIETPALSVFPFAGRTIGSPETRGSLIDDVQLSVIPTEDDGPAIVRVTVQPMVQWLWIGGVMMAVGTALALVPGSRRRPTAPTSAPVAAPESVGVGQ
ncbi:MAG: heme lyase CcmF/NrfE family subunit [Acidimicrobiales bacterium]|nr:heme lyase CcmF/NrfE family subunit [Acidimicrobiales bacterium]RZV45515.1 MAG: heme lyase CcmF/NrfE family subunit [Acidimicrobiales bacterium]